MRLDVWGNSDAVTLDLTENESLSVDYQFSNIQDIGVLSSSFSRTFRLPASPTNVAFFGELQNPNYTGWLNPKRKLKAVIYVGSIPVVRGYLQIKNTYTREGNWSEFEVVVFGEQNTFAKDVGEAKLSDLDYSGLNEDVTWANIQAKWSGAQDLRYGLCDRGRNWTLEGEAGGTVPNADDPIYPGEFTPMVSEPWLIEKIFSEAGWEIDSDFVTNDIDDIYTPFTNGSRFIKCDVEPEGEKFNVGVTTSTVISTNATIDSPLEIGNQSDSGNFWDTNSNYTTGANNYYTCPWAGVYTFNVWFHGTITGGGPTTLCAFVVRNETTNVNEWAGYSNPGAVNIYAEGIEVFAQAGDQIRIGVAGPFASANLTLDGGSSPDYQDGTGWQLTKISDPFYGETMDLAQNAPDMKQIDFIKAVATKYNLVTVPDVNNDKKLEVEPFNDFIGTGSSKDWDSKIDLSKDRIVTPVVDVQNKTLELTYTPDKDILNKWVEENGKRVYGRKLIEDSENDFATQNKKIICGFSATPVNAIKGTTVLIPKFINESGTAIEPKPRTLYWVGEEDIEADTIYVYNDGTSAAVAMTVYGHFGHYDAKIPDVADNDLNFGEETPFQVINGVPAFNLYKRYWEDYYSSIYSEDSRMMVAYFALTATDIHNFKFSDNIYLQGAKWRINKITGFDPTTEQSTKVELIKIVTAAQSCEWTPVSSNQDGSIVFQDASGSTGNGTEACCVFFGGVWDSGKSKCFYPQGVAPEPLAINPTNLSPTNKNAGANKGVGNIITGQKSSIGASNYNLLAATNSTVGDGVVGGVIAGNNVEVLDDVKAPFIMGQNTYGFERGFHYGGNVYDFSTDELIGRGQAGTIVMLGKETFEAENDTMELFIHGEVGDPGRLNLRANTGMSIYCTINMVEYNETFNRTFNVLTQRINFEIDKNASSILRATGTLIENGSAYTGIFTPSVDVSTDTSQHRLIITAGSGTLPTNPIYATCRVDYTMTGLGH